MEKTTQKFITTDITVRDFYCDNCGIHFGTSGEYDDTHRHKLGDVELKIDSPIGCYKMEKCLCDKCMEKFVPNLITTLKNNDFFKENNKEKNNSIEVVKCKDCDVPHNKWTGCPKLNGLVPPSDFYCAFGTPKEKNK